MSRGKRPARAEIAGLAGKSFLGDVTADTLKEIRPQRGYAFTMKTRPISSLLSIAVLALAGRAGAAGFDATPAPKATETTATQKASPTSGKMLDKGMTAEEIVGLIGKPSTVTTLKGTELKAEKWTYRHLLEQRTVQEPTSVVNAPSFNGASGSGNNGLGSRPEMQYTMKYIAIYQVTALLMIDGRLELARQWKEEQVTYDQ